MKTTVEISDELLRRSQQVAKREGTTLRALLEEGLRLALKQHQRRPRMEFRMPSYGEGGLSDEFVDASWIDVREAIYGKTGSGKP